MSDTEPTPPPAEPGWRHARVTVSLPESHASVAVPKGASV